TMFGLFLVFLVGQSFAGYRSSNNDNQDHGQPRESFAEYLTSGALVEATCENWESEFLQLGVYVLFTAWLIQKGSPESKNPGGEESDADPRAERDNPDAPGPVRRGALVPALSEHSLSTGLIALLLLSIA